MHGSTDKKRNIRAPLRHDNQIHVIQARQLGKLIAMINLIMFYSAIFLIRPQRISHCFVPIAIDDSYETTEGGV